MTVTRALGFTLSSLVFGAFAAQVHAQSAPLSAITPPDGFAGSQLVDPDGCIYIKDGIESALWVPRLTREGKPMCGFEPTTGVSVIPAQMNDTVDVPMPEGAETSSASQLAETDAINDGDLPEGCSLEQLGRAMVCLDQEGGERRYLLKRLPEGVTVRLSNGELITTDRPMVVRVEIPDPVTAPETDGQSRVMGAGSNMEQMDEPTDTSPADTVEADNEPSDDMPAEAVAGDVTQGGDEATDFDAPPAMDEAVADAAADELPSTPIDESEIVFATPEPIRDDAAPEDEAPVVRADAPGEDDVSMPEATPSEIAEVKEAEDISVERTTAPEANPVAPKSPSIAPKAEPKKAAPPRREVAKSPSRPPRYVQIGAFTEAENKARAMQTLARLGYPVATQKLHLSSGEASAILAGPFATQGEIAAAVSALRRAGYSDAFARP